MNAVNSIIFYQLKNYLGKNFALELVLQFTDVGIIKKLGIVLYVTYLTKKEIKIVEVKTVVVLIIGTKNIILVMK
mgnify:CR=1 FL=1